MQAGFFKGLFKLNPLGTGKQIIGNEAILAVLASSILSPMLVPTITNYINNSSRIIITIFLRLFFYNFTCVGY